MDSRSNSAADTDQPNGAAKFFKKRFVPLLVLLLVIAMVVILFLFRERVSEFKEWGYLGAFLIGLVANATIFLPMPGLLLLFAIAVTFNPVLVGLAGAAGGAIGEMSGYILGYTGRGVALRNRGFGRAEGWIRKWGVGAIFVFALVPTMPLDIAGLAAGILRFPVWQFLLACFFGKALLYTGVGLAWAWGWEAIQKFLG